MKTGDFPGGEEAVGSQCRNPVHQRKLQVRFAVPAPYVLQENVIRIEGGKGFPVDAIAHRLARSLGERATPLAARLPVLRRPVAVR